MDNDRIAITTVYLNKFLSQAGMYAVQERLPSLNNTVCDSLFSVKLIDPYKVLLTGLFFGGIGADRFALGNFWLGLLRILMLSGGVVLMFFSILFIMLFDLLIVNPSDPLVLMFFTGLVSLITFGIWLLIDLGTTYKRVYKINTKRVLAIIDVALSQ